MKKKTASPVRGAGVALLAGLLFFAAAPESPAYDPSPLDYSRRDHPTGAGRKLGRGLANVGFGWMEVFKGMQDVGEESGFWAGATWGPLYGTMNALRRTAAGVYETATFPFEGPDHFEPIMKPEYVLDDR